MSNMLKAERRIRVLIVDDEPSIRKLLARTFIDNGYTVDTYENPSHCPLFSIPFCTCSKDETCVDIIITDQDMPGVTGLDFIDALMKKNCKCRNIAFMSGCWNIENRQRAQDMGFQVFDKPFLADNLLEWANNASEHGGLEKYT